MFRKLFQTVEIIYLLVGTPQFGDNSPKIFVLLRQPRLEGAMMKK